MAGYSRATSIRGTGLAHINGATGLGLGQVIGARVIWDPIGQDPGVGSCGITTIATLTSVCLFGWREGEGRGGKGRGGKGRGGEGRE